jgi:hypothetical protein
MFYNLSPTLQNNNTLVFNTNFEPGDVVQFVSPLSNFSLTLNLQAQTQSGVLYQMTYNGSSGIPAYFLSAGESYSAVFTGTYFEITSQLATGLGGTFNTQPFTVNNFINLSAYGLLANQVAVLTQLVDEFSHATGDSLIPQEYASLPLGAVPLTASLIQTTPGGRIIQNNSVYEIQGYTRTYAASSDTYEFVNSAGEMASAVVANGEAAPITPVGYVPFQKVSTTFLETPLAPSGITGTGGTLTSGSYTYQVVQLNNSGNSLPSPALTVTVGSSGSVELGWRLVPYATSSAIYRNGYRLATVSGQTYTDTGSATSSGDPLPTTNTSNFVYRSTPLYQVINTNRGKVIDLGLFGPAQNSDITALLLGALDYAKSIYQSGQYDTQYGEQPSCLINAVRVVIPDGQYVLSQSVVVPSGITLDFDGLVINQLQDLYSPCVVWNPGSFSNEIQINANNGSGIQLGQASSQNNIHIGNIRIANVGGTYNAPMNLGQQGITITGYDTTISSAQVFLGSIGLVLSQASDVRIDRIIIVGPYQGIELSESEHVGINYIDIDTPTGLAGYIDSCHDVVISGTMWINGSNYGGSANTRAFLNIGSQSSGNLVAGLRCTLNLLNCGDIPISVANIDQSLLDVIVGPGNLYTGTQYPPQSVISYGSGIGSGFVLRGTAVISTTANWDNGTTPAGGYSIFVNGTLENS